jgi:ABC-type transport system involved in multi-copper enzyme maturation permease subunit
MEASMSNWSLLRVMVLKEFRTTLRERTQITGLIVSILVMVLVAGNAIYQTKRNSHRPRQPTPVHVAPAPVPVKSAQSAAVSRWIAIGIAAGVGFFFSMGYLMTSMLACFVGEKEARTLEILLATPIGDDKLFVLKAISSLLPAAGVGAIFAIGAGILADVFIKPQDLNLTTGIICYAVPLGLLAMMLLQLWFVGIGSAISAKAETMKGAGQTFGVVFMVFFFGGIYGIPLLLQSDPSLQAWVYRSIGRWMNRPFPEQYAMVLLVLGVPAAVFLAIGRSFFRRDRMLT